MTAAVAANSSASASTLTSSSTMTSDSGSQFPGQIMLTNPEQQQSVVDTLPRISSDNSMSSTSLSDSSAHLNAFSAVQLASPMSSSSPSASVPPSLLTSPEPGHLSLDHLAAYTGFHALSTQQHPSQTESQQARETAAQSSTTTEQPTTTTTTTLPETSTTSSTEPQQSTPAHTESPSQQHV
jgi:hypothetical protein